MKKSLVVFGSLKPSLTSWANHYFGSAINVLLMLRSCAKIMCVKGRNRTSVPTCSFQRDLNGSPFREHVVSYHWTTFTGIQRHFDIIYTPVECLQVSVDARKLA